MPQPLFIICSGLATIAANPPPAGPVFVFAGIFVVTVLGVFLLPIPLRYLWNTTMPQLFGLTTITYWQAFQLVLLSQTLFGGL